MTIGIVRVCAIRIGMTLPPTARITSGLSATRAAADERIRSMLSPVQRSSNWTLTPAAQPRLRNSSRNARMRACASALSDGNGIRAPMRRTRSPCARVASGRNTAALPNAAMNSRRLMASSGRGQHRTAPGLRAEGPQLARRRVELPYVALRAADQAAGAVAGGLAAALRHDARHDSGIVAIDLLQQAPAADRQVVMHLRRMQVQPVVVDHIDVGLEAR